MATSATTLIQRTRRYVRDYPDLDALTASVTSSSTTLTVADSTLYAPNWMIQLGSEAVRVRSAPTATTLTVFRGAMGTTPTSHASAATVLIRPAFLDLEILDGLNAGIDACFPLIYRPVLDTSLSTSAATWEYTVPNMPSTSTAMSYVSKVELGLSGDLPYERIRQFDILRGPTPKIKFWQEQVGGATIRVSGYGPFNHLAAGDSLDALWPTNADDLLVEYASQRLLVSGEAGRVRQDIGPVDARENATRTGSSSAAANTILARWQRRLSDAAMGPMPRHVKPTF